MNLIAVLFNFFIKIKSDNSKIEVQKVYLLENNFLNPANRRVEICEGFLYSFQLADERKKVFYSEFKEDNYFYLDCDRNNTYIELPDYLTEKILSCLNSLKIDKNFIRVRFNFTDPPIEEDNECSDYDGKKVYYDTHMWVEKSVNNDGIINLKFDEDKSRAIDIKEKFKQLMGERLYELVNRDNFFISFKELEKTKDFDLRISKSYRECYKGLKSFTKDIQFFGLTVNDTNEGNVNKTIMSPSKFMQRINEMIKKDLERISGDFEKSKFDKFCLNFIHFFHKSKNVLRKKASDETYKSLLERCFDDLKCRMQEKKIFFLIGGKYDDDYYFNELYAQVSRAVKEFQEEYEVANYEDRKVIFREICDLFYDGLIKLQIKANNELFESDFIHEQFSKLLGSDVNTSNDILKIEKIIIDYLNMLTYSSRVLKISGESHLNFYCGPLHFNYGNKCKIVSYLKIKLETSFSNDFKKIEAFNEKSEKVKFERNVHFYLKHHLNCEFYCAIEILRKLNIKKIKITTLNEDLCRMVEVDKYLSD